MRCSITIPFHSFLFYIRCCWWYSVVILRWYIYDLFVHSFVVRPFCCSMPVIRLLLIHSHLPIPFTMYSDTWFYIPTFLTILHFLFCSFTFIWHFDTISFVLISFVDDCCSFSHSTFYHSFTRWWNFTLHFTICSSFRRYIYSVTFVVVHLMIRWHLFIPFYIRLFDLFVDRFDSFIRYIRPRPDSIFHSLLIRYHSFDTLFIPVLHSRHYWWPDDSLLLRKCWLIPYISTSVPDYDDIHCCVIPLFGDHCCWPLFIDICPIYWRYSLHYSIRCDDDDYRSTYSWPIFILFDPVYSMFILFGIRVLRWYGGIPRWYRLFDLFRKLLHWYILDYIYIYSGIHSVFGILFWWYTFICSLYITIHSLPLFLRCCWYSRYSYICSLVDDTIVILTYHVDAGIPVHSVFYLIDLHLFIHSDTSGVDDTISIHSPIPFIWLFLLFNCTHLLMLFHTPLRCCWSCLTSLHSIHSLPFVHSLHLLMLIHSMLFIPFCLSIFPIHWCYIHLFVIGVVRLYTIFISFIPTDTITDLHSMFVDPRKKNCHHCWWAILTTVHCCPTFFCVVRVHHSLMPILRLFYIYHIILHSVLHSPFYRRSSHSGDTLPHFCWYAFWFPTFYHSIRCSIRYIVHSTRAFYHLTYWWPTTISYICDTFTPCSTYHLFIPKLRSHLLLFVTSFCCSICLDTISHSMILHLSTLGRYSGDRWYIDTTVVGDTNFTWYHRSPVVVHSFVCLPTTTIPTVTDIWSPTFDDDTFLPFSRSDTFIPTCSGITLTFYVITFDTFFGDNSLHSYLTIPHSICWPVYSVLLMIPFCSTFTIHFIDGYSDCICSFYHWYIRAVTCWYITGDTMPVFGLHSFVTICSTIFIHSFIVDTVKFCYSIHSFTYITVHSRVFVH